jgi:hypothetical protein
MNRLDGDSKKHDVTWQEYLVKLPRLIYTLGVPRLIRIQHLDAFMALSLPSDQ